MSCSQRAISRGYLGLGLQPIALPEILIEEAQAAEFAE